jgi:hypothetical protein
MLRDRIDGGRLPAPEVRTVSRKAGGADRSDVEEEDDLEPEMRRGGSRALQIKAHARYLESIGHTRGIREARQAQVCVSVRVRVRVKRGSEVPGGGIRECRWVAGGGSGLRGAAVPVCGPQCSERLHARVIE